jgi:glucokinase
VRRALAIDIGGTKFETALVDEDGSIGDRHRVASSGATDGDELFSRLIGLVERLDLDGVDVCGVGAGGPMRKGGEAISPLNIPAWRDFPLRPRLAELTGLPTFVDNDAKALALGEGWRGAARGERNYLAELPGHIRGVLEAEASGTAIAFRTGAPAEEADDAEIRRAGMLVGRAVASVANLLDLKLAVVAGSVALGFGEPFFRAARDEIERVAALQHSIGTRLIPAGLGADGPLVGAAAVGFRGLGADVGVS